MKKIVFSGQIDAIICLDGDLPGREFFEIIKGINIYAADGSAVKLSKIGIEFEKVIGDLDTIKRLNFIDEIPEDKKILIESQYQTDFEKTLDYVIAEKFHNIMVLGFHGGEFEHSLNNWSNLIKYIPKANIFLYENDRYAIPMIDSFNMDVKNGEMISIIPQPVAELDVIGLNWELNHEILELGIREGARNFAIQENIQINIYSGSILLFIDSRAPFAPIKMEINEIF